MAPGKVTFQDLRKNEKPPITDQFLTTPCVRCSDPSHSCLNCSNTAGSNKSGPYGSLNPGKKLGADKWIEELKVKYSKNPKDLLFHNAANAKEKQEREKAPDHHRQERKKEIEEKTLGQQADDTHPVDAAQQLTDRIQNLNTDAGDQSSGREASGSQDLSGDAEPVTPYNFGHDFKEIQTRRAPAATDLIQKFLNPIRDVSDMKLDKLRNRQLDFPARTELAQYRPSTTVLTNHFQLSYAASVTLYEFKVPELEGKGKRKARAIMKSIITNFPVLSNHRTRLATDYFTTIVAWVDLRKLMDNAGHTSISQSDEAAQYRLLTFSDGPTTLRYERTVNMKDLFDYAKMKPDLPADINIKPLIDLFNIIISKCAEESPVATVPGGANKFYLQAAHVPLGAGRSLCTHRGYSYTVKAGIACVLLNVNAITSAFWCPVMFDQVLSDRTFDNVDWNVFDGLVQGLRVYITYERGNKKEDPEAYARLNSQENRIRPIQGLGRRPSQEFFTTKDGQQMSVLEYFNNTYGANFIRDPTMRLVNLGKKDEPRWYPANKLQVLAYQKYKGLVPSHLTTAMLDTACQKPPVAKALVGVEGLQTLGWTNNPAGNQSGEFVLPGCPLFSLRPALLQVGGGILPHPLIAYQNNQIRTPQGGRWRFDKVPFYKRIANTSFNALILGGQGMPANVATNIFRDLAHWTGASYGVATVAEAARAPLANLDHQEIEKTIQTLISKKAANMAVLMLFRKDIPGYSAFKDLCDRKFGLHALCLTKPPERGNGGDRWGNITLKMNLKAAGINHTIAKGLISQGFMKNTLVLGADVTHPGPGSIPGCPSIAAIVGSVDAEAGRFLGSMRLQKESRKEIIDEVEDMVCERIKDWIIEMNPRQQNYGNLPKRIIYYRDGVSESQYDQVKTLELSTFGRAFHKAVKELKIDPQSVSDPKIVAIVCGKRHHVRFYPVQGADKNGNCHPGTTVDDVVTSPYHQDFYLQSHAAIKGTARPAHYFVIANEDNTPVRDIRNFTHELCYTYVRAPVGVSYAAPAYYADRLCERGRCYLRDYFVAPKDKPVRNKFDEFKGKADRELKSAREKTFPSTAKSEQKRKTRQPKNLKLVARQDEDRKKLQEACDKYIMQQAKQEFEKYHGKGGGNPWHPNIRRTMFWM